MSLLEQAKWRYATKKFDPEKIISDEDFETLLEAARLSPTSFGMEPWKILVIQNRKIREEMGSDIDYGFRCFTVDSSNMKDVYYRPNDLDQNTLLDYADNIKDDRTPEDLLIQVMLDLGILLSSKVEEVEIDGKKVFSVADGYLMACFDRDVTEETVTAIAKKRPFYAVFRDSSMASDSVAVNFDQIFENYSPQTVRKVL